MTPRANVLVVDDDQPTTTMVADVLGDEGYLVRTAVNAVGALEAIEVEPPDIILLDLRMPGIDGIDMFRILHERDLITMPIILMTADNHALQEITAQGVKFILFKPFDLDTLVNCVAEALRSPNDTQKQGVPVYIPEEPAILPEGVHICP